MLRSKAGGLSPYNRLYSQAFRVKNSGTSKYEVGEKMFSVGIEGMEVRRE